MLAVNSDQCNHCKLNLTLIVTYTLLTLLTPVNPNFQRCAVWLIRNSQRCGN